LRKPNYGFERAQRNKAKEEKAAAKARKKQEQKRLVPAEPEARSVGPEDEVRGGPEAEEKPQRELDD